jgi:hypothetical protein
MIIFRNYLDKFVIVFLDDILIYNIQEATIVEDVGINIPRIYVSLEDRQTKHKSHMIEVEGKIIIY